MDERRRLMMGQGGGGGSIDLSMVDNAGNPRQSMTTANCYLVHANGDYMIPLVYGNAIKNGAVNTTAVRPGGTTTDTYLSKFVNHAGNSITGPWITKSKSGTGVNKGMGLTVASAELLWQDRAGLITSVSINGDYLKFTVGSYGGGNALIAVKNSNGTILWSWHIWATDDNLSNTKQVLAMGSRERHFYNVSHINLGWVPTGGNGKQGYCPYYQWGRKDPFIPVSAFNSYTNHVVYNINNNVITGITYRSSTSSAIADTIKYPKIFICNTNNSNNVVSTGYLNMWDAQNSSIGYIFTATNKTIYDPCPPGFCVPTSGLWYYFGDGFNRNLDRFDETNRGALWYDNNDIWFPALSFRINNSAEIYEDYYRGGYWSASPANYTSYFDLEFNSYYWTFVNIAGATGCCIRPVAEE